LDRLDLVQRKKQSILPPFAVPPYVAALPKLCQPIRKRLWLPTDFAFARLVIALPKVNPAIYMAQ
jgi:hypothetical protein